MYASTGRPSVPPEQLLKATVLMAMYSIRRERAFCERLNYDLLFKWFLDLPIDAQGVRRDDVLEEPQTAVGSRDRGPVLRRGGRQAKLRRYVSSDHFSVDGTLLEAWASHKSFQPKDGPPGPLPPGRNAEVEFPRATPLECRRTPRRPIPRRAWPASPTRPPRSSRMRGIC